MITVMSLSTFNFHHKLLSPYLVQAKHKIKKAEKSLQKVLANQEPANLPSDLETLTDEERFLFRKIGLSMKPYLLLGNSYFILCCWLSF